MRNAHTLWELLASLAILSTIFAVVAPPIARARDRASVRSAAATLRATLASARSLALTRGAPALVIVDAAIPAITVVVNRDTVLRHVLSGEFRSDLAASRDTIRFGPTGRAFGASNSTLILRTHSAAETVTVSRVGRVR
jgi:Tfp pilus assembly protein FimT